MRCLHPAVQGSDNVCVHRLQFRRGQSVVALPKPCVSLRRGLSHVTSASASSAAAGWPSREPGNQQRSRQAANNASPLLHPLAASPGDPLLHPLAAVAAALLAVHNAVSRAAEKVRSAGRRLARLQVWLGKPEALLFREGCQLLACLMFILLYVWSTYSPVHPGSGRWWLDLVLSLLFAADYVHRTLTSSRSPLLAALHPLALIDVLSFAPSLLGALLPEYTIAPWGWDLRWFRVFRALRLLRLSLLSGNLSTMKTNRGVLIAGNLNVPLVWLVASVVAWMFTSASCVAVMEKLPWHDALYFVGSTLTTVGYGDVVVKSSMGRLFVLVMMLVGVVLIPVRASQLYSRLAERLLVAGHKPGAAPGTAGGYVVLSGRLSDVRGFNDFLQDFLVQVRALSAWRAPGAGGGRQGLQLVCLCNKPSVEFLALQELHESHLTLVEGSAFSERDLLHRAGLPGSVGAMVLADRFSSNATAEDTDVQFRVWAIKSAVKRLPLYVQVLRRSSVDVISPFLDPFLDVIMSVEGTRLRLLALSTLVPGASTLIANLLRSSGPNAGFAGGPSTRSSSRSSSSSAGRPFPWLSSSGSNGTSSSGSSPAGSSDSFDEHVPGFGWQQKLQAAVRSLDDVMISHPFSSPPGSSGSNSRPGDKAGGRGAAGADMLAGRRWLREYAHGAHCELFMVPAGPPLAGLGFTDAAQAVYEASGALVVGLLEVGSQRLLLNPSTLTIHQQQQLVVLAPSYKAAATAAAGAGVEAVLYSQALRAAQDEAAAAAAAVVAAHQAVADQLQEHPLKVDTLLQQQQQQSPAAQPPSVAVSAGAQTGNKPQISNGDSGSGSGTTIGSSSNGSSSGLHRLLDSSLHASFSSIDGSRSVTVRVPDCLSGGLGRGVAMRQRDSTRSAGTTPDYSVSSSSSASGGVGEQHPYPQQRQYAEQLPKLHHPQQQQQWEMPGPASPAAGAVFAQGGHYADAYAAFELQQAQQLFATPLSAPYPAAAGGGGGSTSGSSTTAAAAAGGSGSTPGRPMSPFEDGTDDLVSGCLAPWSGAFESDSLDETELCTDSEMMEAALLMRQKQQAHEEWMQQQQQWLMLRSYDSSSMHKQQAAVGSGAAGQQQQQQPSQALTVVPLDTNSSSTMQGSHPSQSGPSVPSVSVTSITAAALDQQQQQQSPAPQAEVHGPDPQTPPSQLAGHFILAGCASSFVQFARQLAASASPAAEPVTVVLLHPEYQGPALEAIRRMGIVAHHVTGRSSDASALLAAGARRARSLVYVGPSERPTSLPVTAVSGVYGDPTSHATAHADVSSSSRTAVLADADALSSCYGVGEVFLPDSLSTIVELGFTSSIRFLQPGLLLHGRPAPHSSGSVDEAPGPGGSLFPGQQLLAKSLSGLVSGWDRLLRGPQQQEGTGSDSSSSSGRDLNRRRGSSGSGSRGGSVDQEGALRSHPLEEDGYLPTGSPAASRTASPWWQQQQATQQQQQQQQPGAFGQQAAQPRPAARQRQQQQQQQQRLSWPWQQELLLQQLQAGADAVKLPRSSWRHRKEIEEAGQLEGLTEWQLNSYYAAGRVMVPALLDVFTCQGFFRRQALLDLLTELAGDDGRPGGAMLQQQNVPSHLIGCCYHDLVVYYLGHPDPLQRHIPLGLLRRKAENRAWRLPYVATHPHPDTLLQATDLVYVLRPQ